MSLRGEFGLGYFIYAETSMSDCQARAKYILHGEMDMSLWGPGVPCYDLDLKWLSKLPVFGMWWIMHVL